MLDGIMIMFLTPEGIAVAIVVVLLIWMLVFGTCGLVRGVDGKSDNKYAKENDKTCNDIINKSAFWSGVIMWTAVAGGIGYGCYSLYEDYNENDNKSKTQKSSELYGLNKTTPY